MPFTLSLPSNASYVLITVEGPMTVQLAADIAQEGERLAKSSGRPRFLYDLRASRNVEGAVDNYDFAYGSTPIARSMRVALLVDPEDHSHDFVETALLNAGYPVRLFRDEEQAAIDWLES